MEQNLKSKKISAGLWCLLHSATLSRKVWRRPFLLFKIWLTVSLLLLLLFTIESGLSSCLRLFMFDLSDHFTASHKPGACPSVSTDVVLLRATRWLSRQPGRCHIATLTTTVSLSQSLCHTVNLSHRGIIIPQIHSWFTRTQTNEGMHSLPGAGAAVWIKHSCLTPEIGQQGDGREVVLSHCQCEVTTVWGHDVAACCQSRYVTKQKILIFSLSVCVTQPGLSDLHSPLCWPSLGRALLPSSVMSAGRTGQTASRHHYLPIIIPNAHERYFNVL